MSDISVLDELTSIDTVKVGFCFCGVAVSAFVEVVSFGIASIADTKSASLATADCKFFKPSSVRFCRGAPCLCAASDATGGFCPGRD